MRQTVAGGQHRVHQNEQPALGFRQAHQILGRFQRDRIAMQADMAFPCRRHQLDQAAGHAKARAQHCDDGNLLAGDNRRIHRNQRRLDGFGGQWQMAGDFISHQQGYLMKQPLEQNLGRLPVAQMRELMKDQRMIQNVEPRKFAQDSPR